MQTLKLEQPSLGQLQDKCRGEGVVGGKLGVNDILGIKQFRSTYLVAQVGVGLAGIDGVICIAFWRRLNPLKKVHL